MFFSVIIPIHNVEKYVSKGIQCLLNQRFTDFEIILIDDESKDGSGKMCDDFAAKHSNIKVIHQKNTGAGGARNAGIALAEGKYLAFFDIDDVVDNDWLEKIHSYLSVYYPELLIFGYEEINTRYNTHHSYKLDFAFWENNEELRKNYIDKISGLKFNNGFVWNKIYEKDFIIRNNLSFENLRIQQDEVFNLQVYPLANKILTVEDMPYHYYVYYKHNTASHYIPNRVEIYRRVRNAFLEFREKFKLQQDPNFLIYIYKRFCDSVIHDLTFNLFHSDNTLSKAEKFKILEKTILDNDISFSFDKLRSLGYKPSNIISKCYFKAMENKNTEAFLKVYRLDCLNNKIKNKIKHLLKN